MPILDRSVLRNAAYLVLPLVAFACLGTLFGLSGCEGSATQTTNGPAIHGVLVDSEGNPAPGVRVSAWRGSLSLQERPIGPVNSPDAVQRTDAEGRFAFTQMEPGVFNVYSETDNAAHGTYGIVFANEDVDLGQDTLRKPGVLQGRVLANGRPLSDVFCFIPKSPYIAMTDSAGRFQLPAVPKGNHRLRYVHEGFHSVEDSGLILNGGDTLRLPDRLLGYNLALQPPSPTGLTARVDTLLGTVALTWDSVPVADLDGYIIEARRVGKPGGTFVQIGVSDQAQFTDQVSRSRFTQLEGLAYGVVDTVSVTYRVRARDLDGNLSPEYSLDAGVLLHRPLYMSLDVTLTERMVPQDTATCRDTLYFEAGFSSPTATTANLRWQILGLMPTTQHMSPRPTKQVYSPTKELTIGIGEKNILSWTWGQGWDSAQAAAFAAMGKPDTLRVELWVDAGKDNSVMVVERALDVEMPSYGCYRVHASRDPYLEEIDPSLLPRNDGWHTK